MSRTFFSVFLIIALLGIQPVVFSQDGGTSEQRDSVPTIDLRTSTDDEFMNAIQSASGVEIINRSQEYSDQSAPKKEEGPITTNPNPAFKSADTLETSSPSETPSPSETSSSLETSETASPTSSPFEITSSPEVTSSSETAETASPSEISSSSETPYSAEEFENAQGNPYLRESQRFAKLAEEAFTYGDYDAAANFARESIRYARLSDEYVARYMQGESPEDIIAAIDAAEAERIQNAAIAAAITSPVSALQNGVLPAMYTIRNWNDSRDCFWNIAGRPWVYGNPRQWRVLYEANKSKLPDPENPNWLEPGIVLDIPSIKGEVREGLWDANQQF